MSVYEGLEGVWAAQKALRHGATREERDEAMAFLFERAYTEQNPAVKANIRHHVLVTLGCEIYDLPAAPADCEVS